MPNWLSDSQGETNTWLGTLEILCLSRNHKFQSICLYADVHPRIHGSGGLSTVSAGSLGWAAKVWDAHLLLGSPEYLPVSKANALLVRCLKKTVLEMFHSAEQVIMRQLWRGLDLWHLQDHILGFFQAAELPFFHFFLPLPFINGLRSPIPLGWYKQIFKRWKQYRISQCLHVYWNIFC